jgi:hypothetical protein
MRVEAAGERVIKEDISLSATDLRDARRIV